MRDEFPRHIQPDIQTEGNGPGVKSLLNVVEACGIPFARDETRAVVAEEATVGGYLAAIIAPGNEGVNNRVLRPGPDAVESAAPMARIFVIDGPYAKLDLFSD